VFMLRTFTIIVARRGRNLKNPKHMFPHKKYNVIFCLNNKKIGLFKLTFIIVFIFIKKVKQFPCDFKEHITY
jgi:hypothetical protein